MKTLTLTVSGIFDNHVNNYIYVLPQTIESQWGEMPMSQMAYVSVPEGADASKAGEVISSMEQVMNVVVSADNREMFESMMDALEYVIVVIVFSAGLLAAIVLYNLTNINITERIREIATIKVLGFNDKETSAYVFKENVFLTVLGAAGGLIIGKYFLDFVMSKVKIDIVWFSTRLSVWSYIFSVILTILCAVIVNFIFHRKLKEINMAEALKAVE
jgi:putative ABC transport system permease protein